MGSPALTDAALHELVLAAQQSQERARALLVAVLPELAATVAKVIAEADGLELRAHARALRDRIVETLAAELADPAVLARWQATPAERAWGFARERARRLAVLHCDRELVERAAGQDRAAQAVLMRRIRRLFERTARRRGVPPADLEDELQEFYVWLVDGDHRNLRRWDPRGGMGFDRWFAQRSLNRVDSRRRRPRLQLAEAEPDSAADPEDVQHPLRQRARRRCRGPAGLGCAARAAPRDPR